MDRKEHHPSRMLVQYSGGLTNGTCAIHCLALSLGGNIERKPKNIWGQDYGMLVSKYPNWVSVVTCKSGHAHIFDGAKEMFKFLGDLAKYAPGHRKDDITGIYVTDFYNLERIDSRMATFVIGSDVLGPMATSWCRWPTRRMLTTS